MSSQYSSVAISGYNASPPEDDGSEITSNQLRWLTHTDKIGDPLKNAINAVNTNVQAAFTATYGQTTAESAALLQPTDFTKPVGNVLRYGADPTGAAASPVIKTLMEAGGFLITIPKGSYLVDGPILVGSDTYIICEPGVTMAVPTGGMATNLGWIRFRDVVRCGIIGNHSIWKFTAKPDSGEFRHIFDIRGSDDIYIENTIAKDSGGDGYYVGPGAINPFPSNIRFTNIRADNNRRQGMSITSVIGLRVDGGVFENTTGTSPSAGIDIEPDTSADEIKDIRINDVITKNNAGNGFMCVLNDLSIDYELDIVINNHHDEGAGGDGFFCAFGTEMLGRIQYNDGYLVNSGDSGIFIRSWQSNSALIDLNRPTIINPNVNNNVSNAQVGNGITIMGPMNDSQLDIGNVIVREPRIIDNRSATQMKDCIRGSTFIPGGVVRNITILDPLEMSGFTAPGDPVSLISVINHYVRDGRRILLRNNVADTLLAIGRHFSVETNAGAPGPITLTLDNDIEAGPSLIRFEVHIAQELRVDPEAGSAILPGGADGVRIVSSTVGDYLVLRRHNTTIWMIESIHGEWSFSTGPQSILSDGDTGGAASAGAGNQFVELEIGGIVYKLLHDN